MIHVCYAFRDQSGRYAKFAGTSMLSLFENTDSPVTVHILHDNTLTDENREKFSYVAGRHNQRVKFYNLDVLCPEKIAEIMNLVPNLEKTISTVGAFYKLLIPQILPMLDKAIFLDPDTIINLDVNELWETDLDEKVLGVVTESANGVNTKNFFLLCSEGRVKPEDYFNAGVLLMNLKLLRGMEELIMHGVKFRGENPKHKWLELTVLNYCFAARTLKLPNKFNYFVRLERSGGEKTLGRKIYHYAGGSSRQGLNMSDPCNRLWMNYFMRTPWFDAETLGRLFASFQKITDEWKNSFAEITRVMPGKMRAFFVEPTKIDETKNFFAVKDHEKIILAKDENSVKQLLDAMKNCKGACVFFIMTEKILKKNFPFKQLTDAGFVEGKDFFKAWNFLSAEKPAAIDSFPIISAM